MIKHTPLRALYDPKLIGYECLHCGNLFTASLNPSEPIAARNRTGSIPRWVDNKRHARRVRAAK